MEILYTDCKGDFLMSELTLPKPKKLLDQAREAIRINTILIPQKNVCALGKALYPFPPKGLSKPPERSREHHKPCWLPTAK
jgi:hypothetical protein